MACLSKNGEIGQIERIKDKIAYCENGHVLRNTGDGWKQWRKLKPGIDPREAYQNRLTAYNEKLRLNPAFSSWRDCIQSLVSFRNRFLVCEAIAMMPGDPDGVYSELSDRDYLLPSQSCALTIDDCVKLCEAYRAAMSEAKEKAKEEELKKQPQLALE
jgi:hypothetical protein